MFVEIYNTLEDLHSKYYPVLMEELEDDDELEEYEELDMEGKADKLRDFIRWGSSYKEVNDALRSYLVKPKDSYSIDNFFGTTEIYSAARSNGYEDIDENNNWVYLSFDDYKSTKELHKRYISLPASVGDITDALEELIKLCANKYGVKISKNLNANIDHVIIYFKSSSDSADVNRIAKTFERRVSALDRGKLNRSLFGKDRGVDSDTNLVVIGFINSMLVDILKGRSVSEDSLESRFIDISLGSSHRDVYKEAGMKKYCGYCGSLS